MHRNKVSLISTILALSRARYGCTVVLLLLRGKTFWQIPYLCAFYPPWSLPRPEILPEFQFKFVTLTRPDILPAHWNLTRTITNDVGKISEHTD